MHAHLLYLAAAANTTSGSALTNPLNATDLQSLFLEILGYVQYLGSILLVFMIVVVGFQFVLAQGNDEALQKTRNSALWIVIGGVILLGAYALASVIASTATAL
jgi:cytochrome bd-type quinol oxidase subunit 2